MDKLIFLHELRFLFYSTLFIPTVVSSFEHKENNCKIRMRIIVLYGRLLYLQWIRFIIGINSTGFHGDTLRGKFKNMATWLRLIGPISLKMDFEFNGKSKNLDEVNYFAQSVFNFPIWI